MPDDLRTRIAAALYRQAVPSPLLPWEEAFPVVRNVWLGMADAVIAELEAGYVLVPKNVTLVRWADEAFKGQPEGNFKHERITDWKADA